MKWKGRRASKKVEDRRGVEKVRGRVEDSRSLWRS